jgi:hypothetical protein
MSMLAAALAVTIRVYDLYGLPADTRQEALTVAVETLAHAGVEAIIVDCSAKPAATPCKLGLGEGELVLRIHRLPKDGAHTLGDAIVRGESGPNTIATVYATAVAERARRTGGNLATIIGRVSAHELGHLLLGNTLHASHGLMQPSWNLQRVDRGDWEFTGEDAATIRSRLKQRDARALLASAAP